MTVCLGNGPDGGRCTNGPKKRTWLQVVIFMTRDFLKSKSTHVFDEH